MASPPRYCLVSYGEGERYEAALAQLKLTATAFGFDASVLWNRTTLLRDSLARSHQAQLEALDALAKAIAGGLTPYRPFCGAFKMLALLHCMHHVLRGSADSYVLWADASKYYRPPSRAPGDVSIQLAVAALDAGGRRPQHADLRTPARLPTPWRTLNRTFDRAERLEGVYGVVSCPFACDDTRLLCLRNSVYQLVSRRTLGGFAEMIGARRASFGEEAHVLNTHLLLRNTAGNRALVARWLRMALEQPRAFCGSHPQDQSAWTILVSNRSLPVINTCFDVSRRDWPTRPPNCHRPLKAFERFLRALATGRFEVAGRPPGSCRRAPGARSAYTSTCHNTCTG